MNFLEQRGGEIKLIFLLLVALLFTQLSWASNEYNGVYEATLKVKRRSSLSSFVTTYKKQLVRFHLYKYDFPSEYQKEKDKKNYNRNNSWKRNENILPYLVLGKYEEFANAKGEGKPVKVTYFTGYSYSHQSSLKIYDLERFYHDNNINDIKYARTRADNELIIPSGSSVMIKYQGDELQFKKTKRYENIPEIFYPLLQASLKKTSRNHYRHTIALLYKQNFRLDTENFSHSTDNLSCVIYGPTIPNENYITESWFKENENKLINILDSKNFTHGLRFFPKLKTLDIYYRTGFQNKNVAFYKVELNKTNTNISYTLQKTSEAEEYINKAIAADKIKQAKAEEEIQRKVVLEKQKAQQEMKRKLAENSLIENSGFNFTTQGLKNEEVIRYIFMGNFDVIPFNRDDLFFGAMIEFYTYAYARSCNASLPKNSIEIQEDVCDVWTVEKTNGIETSRYCSKWKKVGTDLYASPNLYNAYTHIQNILKGDVLKNVGKMIMQGHNIRNYQSDDRIDGAALKSDIIKLISMNGCNNPALMRFEENLILFAYNKLPIKLDGSVERKTVNYDKSQNFQSLVDDLIYENSKSWAVNKYVKNSVENVKIISKDNENRPIKISAKYSFEGFFGYKQYSVNITFNEGVPDCLYFQDYPNTCRTADRRIVSEFVSGKYIME